MVVKDEVLAERIAAVASEARAPSGSGARVWKDECGFSFITPEMADDGIFLNMKTLQAYSSLFVGVDHERTGSKLYMYMKWYREKEEQEDTEMTSEKKDEEPTKLAIGVEGGFSPADVIGGKGTLVKEYGFAVYPDLDAVLGYPSESASKLLPASLLEAADAIIAMEDASSQREFEAWDASEEKRPVSKFAENLEQLDNGVRISPDPKTWRCEDSGLTENLWLNLSTGYIGSGRRNWDGSGGTGAALKHFEATGRKYPLAVKLGTITADGKADVYSYDPSEDGMVEDPYLGKHLRHFGINIMDLEKTEKSMMEMEIDLNKSITLSAVLEGDEQLVDCYGPGRVGLYNLGNSCYANSVYQVLFSLSAFRERFFYSEASQAGDRRSLRDRNREKERLRMECFKRAPDEPQTDLETQLVKLAAALSDPSGNGIEALEDDNVVAVAPKMLKDCLGHGHPDFGTREQQDSREYFQFVLDRISRMERANTASYFDAGLRDPSRLFSFLVEERLECQQSGKVKYQNNVSNVLMLSVPAPPSAEAAAAAATAASDDDAKAAAGAKSAETEEAPPPLVSFEACLAASLGDSAAVEVDDYLSPATGQRGKAVQIPSMSSFPQYLAVQLKRYVLGDDWVPKKIDARVPVPRDLDFSAFRGQGLQSGEEELPDLAPDQTTGPPAAATPDEALLQQLTAMGFNENGCKRALLATGNNSAEAAMQWVLEHMGDADFNDPPSTTSAPDAGDSADAESVAMLTSMGFEEDGVKLALKECGGNMERAADWLFSHAAELSDLVAADKAGGGGGSAGEKSAAAQEAEILSENDAREGHYVLRGFISHIGKTPHGGHYLAHCNLSTDLEDDAKDDWVIFNDRKVAKSKNPPFEYGLLYVFERISS
ncbi:Ubiquitin carboxyl-terminal hydrolase 5 [Hondaea fermentalgiana]|uniref:Ubiquitin carboxyl-terminal hydrolase 14 n=1 Tax=Hondaea fermentalgiana TaxID=2315210 RepID=A0A2R5GGB5_9STRA|nr:Ubiquitin carboxyl-terminal hydrolase 5 [Hondaea fermentalgiana]|eukprot:GBG29389.1 Ubiquitin carboxyl-terminal hydrolase 5 [Hondaea fermentalgiana]